MIKLLPALLLTAPILADQEFERPSFHELKDNQTLVLENIGNEIKELKETFFATNSIIEQMQRTNQYLEEMNAKFTYLLDDSQKSLHALEIISWHQEHNLDAAPVKRK